VKELPGPRFFTESGIPVFLEPSEAIPLVDVELVIGDGAFWDPPAKAGLTRMTSQMVRAVRAASAPRSSTRSSRASARPVDQRLFALDPHPRRGDHANLEAYLEAHGPHARAPRCARAISRGSCAGARPRLIRAPITIARWPPARSDRTSSAIIHHGLPINGSLETIASIKRSAILEH
jgi:hypothetical protein